MNDTLNQHYEFFDVCLADDGTKSPIVTFTAEQNVIEMWGSSDYPPKHQISLSAIRFDVACI